VIQLSGQFVPVKLNGEKDGAAQDRKFGVQGFPTILFIDSNENVVGKIGGYEAPDAFSRDMQRVLTTTRDYTRFKRTLAQNPKDFEALAGMADAEYSRGDAADGKVYLQKAEAVRAGRHSKHLGLAYASAGISLMDSGDWNTALPFIQKAESNVTDPEELVMTRMNLAVCYLNLNQPKKAIAPLQKVLAFKKLPPRARQQAEAMLADAKK